MKRIALLLIGLLVLTALVAACSSDDDNTPTGIVKHMIKAFEKGDSFNWKHSFCDPNLADLTLLNKQEGVDFSFKNTSYKKMSESGSSARVAFSGTVESDIGGVKVSTDLDWAVDVEKQDGDWCIVSIADVSS